VRIALVSPYSWTRPGGVVRHVDALARELLARGHEVAVLTPADAGVPLAPHVLRLGGTVSVRCNGAVSTLALTPSAVARLRAALRGGEFDVVHVHSPEAPAVGWHAVGAARAPVVVTSHAASPSRASAAVMRLCGSRRHLGRCAVRIAVSRAAEETLRRWHPGPCRVIPNGVHLPPGRPAPRSEDGVLDVAFVGQAVERKGLPVLLRAFAALRAQVPARLTLVGPRLPGGEGVTALGPAGDAAKAAVLDRADVLCAPSLRSESFGMVLTEAFARATPVVASDLAGYREVVREGVDGLLVPPGDPAPLAAALRALAADPARRAAMGAAARERAEAFAWPAVADAVEEVYGEAVLRSVRRRSQSVQIHGSEARPAGNALSPWRTSSNRPTRSTNSRSPRSASSASA